MVLNKRLSLFFKLILGAFLGLIVFPQPASANAGLPMIVIIWPAFGILLIPIILIEWLAIKSMFKPLQVAPKKLLWSTAFANLFSTIVGVPLVWFLMVGIEALGSIYVLPFLHKTFSNAWSDLFLFPFMAPWLPPFGHQLYWMVPAACLILLIPCFFASYFLEKIVMRYLLRHEKIPEQHLKKGVWSANLKSYFLLGLIVVIFLIVSIFEKYRLLLHFL